ncbi:MAG: site-specific tyrosine recombinase/integron integrase [bacterium]
MIKTNNKKQDNIVTNDFLLENYKYYLLRRGLSQRTIKEYISDIKGLFIFLQIEKMDLQKIENFISQIKNYVVFLKMEKNNSNRGINRKISSFKSFLKFLWKEKYVNNNYSDLLETMKTPKTLPKAISMDDFKNIISNIDFVFSKVNPKYKEFIHRRNKLIFMFLIFTGLRVSELVNVKIFDIDFFQNTIKVKGKGDKERIVIFSKHLKDFIEEYLNVRDQFYKGDYLFASIKGKKMNVRTVQYVFQKVSKVLALKFKITPHTMRHTFATIMLENGSDIVAIKELLGHSNLNTTQIYTKVSVEHLKKNYKLEKI